MSGADGTHGFAITSSDTNLRSKARKLVSGDAKAAHASFENAGFVRY
jgi:hypothetical protein